MSGPLQSFCQVDILSVPPSTFCQDSLRRFVRTALNVLLGPTYLKRFVTIGQHLGGTLAVPEHFFFNILASICNHKLKESSRYSRNYYRLQETTKKCQTVPENSRMYQKLPKITREYQKVPENTRFYQK